MQSTETTLNQQSLLPLLEPIFKKEGKIYKKTKAVFVRKAIKGEEIITNTSDGKETKNKAKQGDHVIKNQTKAGEEYLVSKKKLLERYKLLEKKDDTYSVYQPIGTIHAIELEAKMLKDLGLGNEFWFVAAWGEKMVAKKGDFLVLTPEKEIYRIARKEFFETYSPEDTASD